jgi:hypothetical protein
LTGFIETNTLGPPGTPPEANFPIIDWNLRLTIGKQSADLTGPLSGNNSFAYLFNNNGTNLTATATELFFDFAATDDGFENYLLFALGNGASNGPVVGCVTITLPRMEVATSPRTARTDLPSTGQSTARIISAYPSKVILCRSAPSLDRRQYQSPISVQVYPA